MLIEKGTVVRRTKGFYYLRTATAEEIECKVKGRLFKDSRFDNQIAVGDVVHYRWHPGDGVGLITAIEERKSFLSRARVGVEAEQVIAANIDYLLIVASAAQPAFRANLINRMLVAAAVGNISPILVVTKTDLVEANEAEALVEAYRTIDLTIFYSSIDDTDASLQLQALLTGNTCLLAGQSGVGKSSLLNRFFPGLNIRVGRIGAKSAKGVHTTTFAQMHRVAKNGFVIDTPGIREFGLWHVTRSNLGAFFPAINAYHLQCRHRDCAHIHEPNCTVKAAVETDKIHRLFYEGYLAIYEALER
jgi:ribosome biogenesis GTPase / thiamine phosphate phosphatase